ncbi:MAG: peroxiredoxin [Thermoplasmata archaeon]
MRAPSAMLRRGDPAPSFTGTTHDGRTLTLDEFRGRPLVLYFYPKASTAGCTAEAKGFAQNYAAFRAAGIAVVGVSVDSVEAQAEFARDCGLPFPLIADRDRTLARHYGVLGLLGFAKRTTFFVGADGRIEEIVQGMLPGPHVRRAIERSDQSGNGPKAPAKP